MEEFPASKVHLSTTCNRTYYEVSQQTSREPGSRAKWGGGGWGGKKMGVARGGEGGEVSDK